MAIVIPAEHTYAAHQVDAVACVLPAAAAISNSDAWLAAARADLDVAYAFVEDGGYASDQAYDAAVPTDLLVSLAAPLLALARAISAYWTLPPLDADGFRTAVFGVMSASGSDVEVDPAGCARWLHRDSQKLGPGAQTRAAAAVSELVYAAALISNRAAWGASFRWLDANFARDSDAWYAAEHAMFFAEDT